MLYFKIGNIMNNDVKGVCLFMGLIGLGYVFLLVILACVTGVKIIKSILFISVFSSCLVAMGLTSKTKQSLFSYFKSLTIN